MPKIFIILVNYKSKENLLELFDSLSKLEFPRESIFGQVLDVTGEIGSEILPQGFSVLRIPENRGYAYSVNIGLTTAIQGGFEYVWILNPDVILRPMCLTELAKVSKSNPSAVVGSAVYSLTTNSKENEIWGMGGYIGKDGEVKMGESLPGNILEEGGCKFFECDYVPGCCMFLPTKILKRIGFLPEQYFLYFEETEWCLRSKERGIKMLISIDSEIKHKVYPGKLEEPFRVYFYNRSKRTFLWRNRGSFEGEENILVESAREFFSIAWAVLSSPRESKKLFLAHFFSVLDFFVLNFFLGSLRRASRLSRKRLSSLSSE